LEEAPYQTFVNEMGSELMVKKANEINTIPANSTVIIGLHKDNSTAYKSYKISEASKKVLSEVSKNPNYLQRQRRQTGY
jgi:hypothetical protein